LGCERSGEWGGRQERGGPSILHHACCFGFSAYTSLYLLTYFVRGLSQVRLRSPWPPRWLISKKERGGRESLQWRWLGADEVLADFGCCVNQKRYGRARAIKKHACTLLHTYIHTVLSTGDPRPKFPALLSEEQKLLRGWEAPCVRRSYLKVQCMLGLLSGPFYFRTRSEMRSCAEI
jgi:hypothetical protein